MKTALLHYWLHTMRGGEKLLAELCRMLPEATVFTHAVDPEKIAPEILAHPIRTSFIARLPGARRHSQRYLPLMPMASRQWDLAGMDLIVSSESGPVKNIRKPAGSRHICYCHSPMRYVWDMYDEYYRAASLTRRAAMRLCRRPLQRADRRSAGSVDQFIANSRFVADRIRRIYQRDALVIPPPVDTDFFGAPQPLQPRQYWLWAGELTCYKHPEMAIEACRRTGAPLIVAGGGDMLRECQKNAPPHVHFTGRVTDAELRRLYAGARGLLFPGIEDFGMIPVEAQAAGTPVIALAAGGALETVINRQTGVFFAPDRGLDGLLEAMEEAAAIRWDESVIREHARTFSPAAFRARITPLLTV